MIIHLGYVHELVRYPVKSMAGIATDSAFLGWHGLQGIGALRFVASTTIVAFLG
jgi:hypothetical protein